MAAAVAVNTAAATITAFLVEENIQAAQGRQPISDNRIRLRPLLLSILCLTAIL